MAKRRVGSATYRATLGLTPDSRCAVCGWHIPPPLRRYSRQTGIQAHHIQHVALGGPENDAGNMVPLCPNHHALAHILFPRVNRTQLGPMDAEQLVNELRQAEAFPDDWKAALSGTSALRERINALRQRMDRLEPERREPRKRTPASLVSFSSPPSLDVPAPAELLLSNVSITTGLSVNATRGLVYAISRMAAPSVR